CLPSAPPPASPLSLHDALPLSPPESAATGIEITDEFSSALRAMREGRNVFLTGKAGTGKSTLVRKFLGESTKNVQVVAPTGLAADRKSTRLNSSHVSISYAGFC